MKIHLTIIFLLITPFLFAQVNLVPNPSFEEYTVCPDAASEINYAVSWYSSTTSCDLYNSCSSSADVSVPDNSMGTQEPLGTNCKGYAGIFTYIENLNYREYIYAKLDSQLLIGKKYYISFYVSLADDINCGIDKIGILLTTNQLIYGTTIINNFVNYSQVRAPSPITDRINWIKISGSFVADSNYDYVNIGNFYSNENTDAIKLDNLNCTSYYFIDDICVSTDSLTCYEPDAILENNSKSNSVNIFPNPATDELTIDCALTDKSYFELFDLIGAKRKAVMLDCGSQTKRIDLTDIDSGLYFYSVVDRKGNRIKTGKLIVIK